MQPRVKAIGGVFFKSEDPEAMKSWYKEHLGIQTGEYGSTFGWRHFNDKEQKGYTAWCPFNEDTKYFQPSEKSFMINYRVDDLEGLIENLRESGVKIVGEIENYEYGKFAHIMDPEGNKIELWESDDEEFGKILGDAFTV